MSGDLRIGDAWIPGEGPELVSLDPASGEPVRRLHEASAAQVAAATAAAARALPSWSETPLEDRIEILRSYRAELESDREGLARAISRETGKPHWEALTEVDAMLAKVPVSIEMQAARRSEEVREIAGQHARTHHRPIGVLAVLGPFNLPGHLPNGQIVPALLAGNAIVLKPSEQTPDVGHRLVEALVRAGIPDGVVGLVQGGRDVGQALLAATEIAGVLFTGSHAAGRAISRALADRPEVLLALEMGGNNPLVVDEASDVEAAVAHTLLSAFITAGQRCTCARRLIVPLGEAGDRFVAVLVAGMGRMRVGLPADRPEPFVGPLVSPAAAARVVDAEADLLARGGRSVVALRGDHRSPALLHPGLIDVTDVAELPDEEVFGPLLQLVRVADFEAALSEANRTAFGLSAALLSDDRARFERFARVVRAGIVNWNRQTTGASGQLPFGGVGRSGNHRPAGAWTCDFCSDPVAMLESETLAPPPAPPGLVDDASDQAS